MASVNGGKPEIAWKVTPYREHPLKTVLVSVFIIVLWISIHITFKEPVYTLLGIVFISGSVIPYFRTTRYEMNENGIEISTRFRKVHHEWNEFRKCSITSNGVCLSPFSRTSRLGTFRSLYLLVPAGEMKTRVRDVAERLLERMDPGVGETDVDG
jgi:hypothetical protein